MSETGARWHPEAEDGSAFNGDVGRGLADKLESVISGLGGVRRVCDIGCGNGYLASRLGQRGWTVHGIDGSAPYVEVAERTHTKPGITFAHDAIDAQMAERIRRSHEPFDLVVSTEVIEHLYEPQHLVQTAFSILRPGGQFVISTPYHGYLKNVAISVLDQWDLHHSVHWRGGHIKFFSVASLTAMLREAGFNQPRFEYYGRFAGFWKNMIAVATRD